MPRLPSCLFVFFVVISTAAAADFPQFRGPAGDGHAVATNLPTTWNETTNVAWKTPVPGKGWSSPSLYQDRLYLTTAVPTGRNLSLAAIAVDAKTGTIIWQEEVFAPSAAASPKIHNKNSHASPTPLVAGDRIYVHSGHQGTACLDLAGKVLWKNQKLKYEPVHGNGGSPILVEDLLVFSCDGADKP